jgi:hypothetical protein
MPQTISVKTEVFRMRINKKILLVALAAMGAATSQMAQAQRVSCTTSGCTTAGIGVTFNITIPAVLRFQVGDTSGVAPTVNWAATVTAANIGDSVAQDPDSITLPGTGASGNQVVYRLTSNLGGTNVTVAAAATTPNGPTCGAGVCSGTFIPWAEILRGNTGSLSNPAPGASTTAAYGGSTIDITGFWTYQYANTTIPLEGSYTGIVTYTAADD